MKKKLRSFSVLLLFVLAAAKSTAQSFTATYSFTNITTTSGRTDPTPVPTATGVTFGSFTAVGSGLSANPNAGGRFSFTGWPTGATNGSDVFTGTADAGRYYEVTITPQANFTLSLNTVTFTLQRSGTGIRQYAVRSSADGYAANLPASIEPANVNLQVVAGNIFQVADATTSAENGSKITLSGFTNISSPITFRFYGFNAEASGGTFSIDNVVFSGTATISQAAANIVLDTSSLNFPPTAVNGSSVLNYTLRGDNLTDQVTITTAAPYSVSTAANGTYSTTLTIPAADVATAKPVYVKFSPTATGTFTGTISNSSSGATAKTVSVTGDGIDPANLTFNFDNCTLSGVPGGGFTSYSVSGAQSWICSNFGRNSTHGVEMNGYSGGPVDNEDWLISPPLAIGSVNLPILRFWSRGEFTGPSLQLLVSTDYTGSGNPNNATWTDLQASFPALNNTWTLTDGIDLTPYKSFPKVYIAFKYISSVELGAARWTLDDVDVTNRSMVLSASPLLLNFNEVSAGNNSASQPFTIQSIGYGDITLTAPAGYQLSTNNTVFTNSITLPQATAQSGTTVYARFSPIVKALKIEGAVRFTGTGLDSSKVTLTGTSYPKAETFDAGCYNLSFFGSNSTNNPTPQKITTQVNNIATVIQRLNLDVLGVEEVSNDVALDSLIAKLPHHKAVISPRWSYSFDPPDPAFPPQKTGFIYDTTTMRLIEQRDMFVGLYDSARTGYLEKLPNYPGGTPSSFWASGRLPFMATFNATINGVTRRIRVIDIHAKSASDVASYNRRVYDVKVLKDSLDAYYSNDNIIIVGDYNDRVFGSIYAGSSTSPYKIYVDDSSDYVALTFPLDSAGRVSFITGTGLIDHITISNELKPAYISNSTDIEDPRSYISGYNATTASDHLPVFTRFNLSSLALPVVLTNFNAQLKEGQVLLTWSTVSEHNSSYFVVERSEDGKNFTEIDRVGAAGNSNAIINYSSADTHPLEGLAYYRLKQVDFDGRTMVSDVVTVNLQSNSRQFSIFPNPVTNHIQLNLKPSGSVYTLQVATSDGKIMFKAKGSISEMNKQINQELSKWNPGVYILQLTNKSERYISKFIRQ